MSVPGVARIPAALLAVLLWAGAAAGAVQTSQQELAATAAQLRRQLALEPDNGDVARRLAQTLYWLGDIDGAHRVYADAATRHPGDFTLRLQYARMLVETGEGGRARNLLEPLLTVPGARAEAEHLLGLLAYWGGDLREATRRFDAAVRHDPGHAEAAGHLRDIRAMTSPWVRLSSGVWHDNQPLDRLAAGMEAGWFATPATSLTARVEPARYDPGGETRSAGTAELALTHRSGRMEAAAAGGAVRRPGTGASWDWTGRASLGLRFPHHVTARVQVDRAPYFSTTASLRTPVMVETGSAIVQWGSDLRGWLGEIAFQVQRYPDDNAVQTGYGWLLVPLLRRDDLSLQAGYGFSGSDASESRFRADGRYDPYYTPDNLARHSALAGLTLGRERAAHLRLDGSASLRTTDDAPVFVVVDGDLVESAYRRTSSPWTLRAAASLPLRDGLTLEPRAEAGRTVFYSWAAASLHLTIRLRRVGQRD